MAFPHHKNNNMKYFILTGLFLFTCFAEAAEAPQPVDVPNTLAERVKACTICHGEEDKASRDAYYPRIAGKLEGYLYNQLRHFRDGRRYYQPMAILLENMSDTYLREIAQYFAGLEIPYPPPESIVIPPVQAALAEKLVYSGDPEREVPACSACHGQDLMGTEPFVPGLLGLHSTYLAAQLGGWHSGGLIRGKIANCMADIAKQLTYEEINALAKWLAAQPASGEPANALPAEMAQRCANLALENGDSR
ncbi:Cytochrome c553 [Nitrosomonas nitrosa]|uniref:Cytochrome c553 n=1 Tax=Nitrosomonas nitrosa TaxID=52442 RepID=A0A8H8YYA0_9PROT|nr:c-type cytochrome [Nitrosomonas nitrosa]CAE6496742.1 Cytochrome c553 [Nitrosomonas nitrosa]